MFDINEFIASINANAVKNSIEVFLPSFQRVIKFKPVSTKQYKDLYACIKDNILYNTKFIIVTYNIIKDNCLEPDILDQINIIDRAFILLALRRNILGTTVKNIDFNSNLALASTIVLPEEELLTVSNIKISTQIPTLKEVYEMEVELRGDLKEETVTIDALTENLIIGGCCKFIKKIQVEDTDLNFKAFNYKERIKLVESLPAATLNSIQNFAEKVTSLQDNITNVLNSNGTRSQFYINTDFFLAE